jgi:solute carrier family 25 carnitine/acylcarnitine transporter 20/29
MSVKEIENNKNKPLLSLNDFISGSIAGVIQVLVGQPFDMLKIRMQTKPTEYTSISQTAKKIILEESPFALYKGTLSPLIGISFCVAIQFSSNAFARNYFTSQNSKNKNTKSGILSTRQNILAGLFAGFCNSFITSPIELIRIKLQVQGNSANNKYKGTFDCASQIIKNNGIKGIYLGLCSTLLRECPAYAIYFGLYETLMHSKIMKYGSKENTPIIYPVIFGGISGIGLWLLTFPFDVVKSKIQADDSVNRKYNNILNTFKIIHMENGIGGFFKGIAPCLVRAPLVNGLTFLAFESVSKLLKNRNNK